MINTDYEIDLLDAELWDFGGDDFDITVEDLDNTYAPIPIRDRILDLYRRFPNIKLIYSHKSTGKKPLTWTTVIKTDDIPELGIAKNTVLTPDILIAILETGDYNLGVSPESIGCHVKDVDHPNCLYTGEGEALFSYPSGGDHSGRHYWISGSHKFEKWGVFCDGGCRDEKTGKLHCGEIKGRSSKYPFVNHILFIRDLAVLDLLLKIPASEGLGVVGGVKSDGGLYTTNHSETRQKWAKSEKREDLKGIKTALKKTSLEKALQKLTFLDWIRETFGDGFRHHNSYDAGYLAVFYIFREGLHGSRNFYQEAEKTEKAKMRRELFNEIYEAQGSEGDYDDMYTNFENGIGDANRMYKVGWTIPDSHKTEKHYEIMKRNYEMVSNLIDYMEEYATKSIRACVAEYAQALGIKSETLRYYYNKFKNGTWEIPSGCPELTFR